MIDAPAVISAYLLSKTVLTTVTGTRIWPERSTPFPNYNPTVGGAIAFKIRGGTVIYSGQAASPSVQFKCYGVDELAANTVYRALYDVLNNKHGGGIKAASLDVLGQSLGEPDTGWPFVLCFYTVWLGI